MMPAPAALFLVALSASWLPAQTTHIVTGGGANLQTAINIAVAGDTLDVQSGTYTPVTCSKGVRILLRSGVEVGMSLGPLAMLVTGVPAQEVFVLDGGRVYGLSVTQSQGAVVVNNTAITYVNQVSPMEVRDCSGPVVFDSFDCSSPPASLTHGPVNITNCQQVSFHNSRPKAPIVTNSHVSLSKCFVTPYGFQPGVQLNSGSVTISGGRVVGGTAASWPILESGVELNAGELTLTGGASIEASSWAVSNPFPAITTTGGSIRFDPSVNLVGLPIAGPAVVTTAPVPSLSVLHSATTMNVNVRAAPGSAVFTFGGLAQPVIPTPWGEAWLLPTDPLLDVSIAPLSGAFSFGRSFTAVPPHFVLVLQSVAVSPSGSLVVGAPVRFVWE